MVDWLNVLNGLLPGASGKTMSINSRKAPFNDGASAFNASEFIYGYRVP
jgi:hypothetical protein